MALIAFAGTQLYVVQEHNHSEGEAMRTRLSVNRTCTTNSPSGLELE